MLPESDHSHPESELPAHGIAAVELHRSTSVWEFNHCTSRLCGREEHSPDQHLLRPAASSQSERHRFKQPLSDRQPGATHGNGRCRRVQRGYRTHHRQQRVWQLQRPGSLSTASACGWASASVELYVVKMLDECTRLLWPIWRC